WPKRTNSGLLDGTEPADPRRQIVLQSPVVLALGASREVTLAEASATSLGSDGNGLTELGR
ncbi:MAG TPA: hypothetical protein VIK13_16365, partial [Candidatus Limnocylindrales bacterium]